MATTTPNYLWSVPTSSDLVKNGATAIETLGDSVDASLWSSGYGQAGKNKIINGDFTINQRAFTTTTSNNTYLFDRYFTTAIGGTSTYTAQTFALGTAPVAGYEGKNYLDVASTGQSAAGDATRVNQSIESVRTFANQTVTISFWAKAASGTPKVAVEVGQVFGTGGSSAVNTIVSSPIKQTINTSWNRYFYNITVPSISSKTIGPNSTLELNIWLSAGSDFNSRTGSLGIQSNTFQIWGVQVEAGNQMTSFSTASGSIGGELALCQRYYWRFGGQSLYNTYGMGIATSSTNLSVNIQNPVPMRVNATSVDFAVLGAYNSGSVLTVTNAVLDRGGTFQNSLNITTSGMTTNNTYALLANNSSSSYFGLSAEL
jgi:hypothetical protein